MHAKSKNRQLTIGIAAPASPFDKKLFFKGVKKLEKCGFKIYFRKQIFEKSLYLAGSDKLRVKELEHLFLKKEVDVIMFARGGYGTQRIIPFLNLAKIKRNSKIVVGFSDLTPLLNILGSKCGCKVYYGPVVGKLGGPTSQKTLKSLQNALNGRNPLKGMNTGKARVFKGGRAKGRLCGGCLTMISTSIGTMYDIDTRNKILFIEDVDEESYSIDRLLTQLINANKLKNVKGILIGSLVPSKGYKIENILNLRLKDFKGPIIYNLPIGHCNPFFTLPLGINVKISTSPVKIELF